MSELVLVPGSQRCFRHLIIRIPNEEDEQYIEKRSKLATHIDRGVAILLCEDEDGRGKSYQFRIAEIVGGSAEEITGQLLPCRVELQEPP